MRATDPSSAMTEDFIDSVIDRWRGATMSKQNALDGAAGLRIAGARRVLDACRPAGALDRAAADDSAAGRVRAAPVPPAAPPASRRGSTRTASAC